MKLVQWKQTNHLSKYTLYHRLRLLKDGSFTTWTLCGKKLPDVYAVDSLTEPIGRRTLGFCCRRCLGIA